MIVLFVHGLRQGDNAWGLLTDSICNAFDAKYQEVIYSAKLRTRSNLERAAQLLITKLEAVSAEAKDHELVIVGYSLGGLVAREALRQLLEKQRNADALLNKIEGVVTLGTPLHGSTRSRAAKFFGWLFRLRWLREIGKQDSEFRIPYPAAIKAAEQRKARRPKFYHVEFEEDEWSRAHSQELYTEDDNAAGVLPGSHTPLASGERPKEISQTVIRLIRSMRSQQKALAPSPSLPATGITYNAIILIACSNTKASGGGAHLSPLPGAWLSDRHLADRLLEKRALILDKLKTYQIQDQTYSQGNRGDRPQNQSLIRGPDFGFDADDPVYMRAVDRYRGRFYGPLVGIDWDEFHARLERPLILIMSGLYGFVQSNEMIQNYDAHTSDVDLSSAAQLWSLWADWFTPALNNAVLPFRRKVPIINLLGDNDYVRAIQWAQLDHERTSIYHLVSDQWENIDLLTPAGVVLSGLVRDPKLLASLERSTRDSQKTYPLSRFGEAAAPYSSGKVAFETRVGDVRGVIDWSRE